jgi:hypothetical protein
MARIRSCVKREETDCEWVDGRKDAEPIRETLEIHNQSGAKEARRAVNR